MILGIDGRLANQEERAGAGRYCLEVLRALDALGCGVQLRVYLDRPPVASFPLSNGVDVRVLSGGHLWTHWVLARELRHDPPDVFFSPVTQLPRGCPCPSLISVLDLAVRSHAAYFPFRKRLSMRLQTDYAVRRASHLLAISEATARDIRHYYRVPSERITVAHLGCSAGFFQEAPIARTPGTILDTLPERYILYIGQVQPRKNLVRLIDAFARVCGRSPDLPHHLVICGGMGWQNSTIFTAAKTSPAAGRIHFLDYMPERQLPALVAGADVLALVSLWEGFGLPAIEAMATGTAVLASNVSSLPEVVGDAGVLVDPTDTDAIADGLARLLGDVALRAVCEAQGRVRAQKFRWENTARAIVEAAEGLAKA